MHSQVPEWAFFRSLRISDDDQTAQHRLKRPAQSVEALFANAEEIKTSEKDGVTEWSCYFRLDQGAGRSPEKATVVAAHCSPLAPSSVSVTKIIISALVRHIKLRRKCCATRAALANRKNGSFAFILRSSCGATTNQTTCPALFTRDASEQYCFPSRAER